MIQRHLAVVLLLAVAAALQPAPAAAQHFGRNKVQYRAFDFQVIKTAHFDVYFYPQERQAALDAARMAERSYARLSRVLQHQFKERKPIILYASHADFQQTNAIPSFIDESTGGVTEPLKNRVILPFTGSYADFEHVLTHELVHAFQFDVIFRRGVVTDASPFGLRPPLWFMEGMAEYLSIGKIDAHTSAWLRDAAMSGYLRSIAEMNQRDDYLSYRFGQALWAYIGSKWGDEVVGILLQKAPRTGVERAFQTTLGLTLDELSQEWMAAVRKTYLPQMAQFERPDRFARQLSQHKRLEDPWYLAPAISPDGKLIVFLSQRDGFSFDLWLADAETGKVRQKLIEGEQEDMESLRFMNSSASFSPDGRFLAFSAQSGGRDALVVYDIEKNRVRTKLRPALNGIANPTWSPDGQQIAFTGVDGGISDLYVIDLEGRLQRLTDDRYADLFPAWSPDGRAIAFTTDRAGADFDRLAYGNYRVALYDLETQRTEVLPNQESGKNLNPVWAPDSRALVWVSDRTGTNDLYLFDRDERKLFRVSDVLSGVIAITALSPVLAWAKDDGRLIFTYFERAGYNLYSVDDPRKLRRIPVTESRPEAAPVPVASAASEPDDGAPPVAAAGDIVASSFYRQGATFRPSAERPAGEVATAPISVVALLDSAEFALPDSGDFRIGKYDLKFTPDIVGRPTVGAQVGGYYGNGLYGGSFIALSDMLGNHNILLAGNVNGSFSDATFFGGYSFLKTRANYNVAVEQIPFYRYLGGGPLVLDVKGEEREVAAHVLLRDVIRTGQGFISYPFSRFRRLELGARATNYRQEILFRGYILDTREPFEENRRLDAFSFVEPTAALVFDNSLFGWTGPVYGRRYRIQASRTFGDFGYTEALVDFRNYTSYKRKLVFASRILTLSRFGADADRFALFWGGPYFIRGYNGNSFELDGPECVESRTAGVSESLSACPVRDQLIGSSAAFMNLELRFPVITELQIGFLGSFPPVDAVLFFDGGMAWDNKICLERDLARPNQCASGQTADVRLVWDRQGEDPYLVRAPLFSWGLGLRINVFYTVLRLDYAFPLDRPDRGGRFSVSFGPSF